MSEEAPSPEPKKGGSTLKTVLIVVILVLLLGVTGGVYFLFPEKIPENRSYQWPPEGENAIEVSATLSDGSAVLLTSVRFETVPCDLEKFQADIEKEFQQKRSIIENVLTEAAMGLNAETVLGSEEFRKTVRRKINEEMTSCEVDRILIKDWMVASSQ